MELPTLTVLAYMPSNQAKNDRNATIGSMARRIRITPSLNGMKRLQDWISKRKHFGFSGMAMLASAAHRAFPSLGIFVARDTLKRIFAFFAFAAASISSPALGAGPANGVSTVEVGPTETLVRIDSALPKTESASKRVGLLAEKAVALMLLDRLDEADRAIAEARPLLAKANRADKAELLFAEANILGNRQSNVAATQVARECLDLRKQEFGGESIEAAGAQVLLARLLISQSQFDEGIEIGRAHV